VRILALDVSTKSTGWFVAKRSCGTVVPPVKESLPKRLSYFRKQVEKLILRYKPDIIVLEDVYYQPRKGSIHTLKSLSQFAGVVLEVAGTHAVPVEIMTATQARKWCCGKQEGVFKKPEVFEFFVEKYKLAGWNFKTHNDITDAMGLFWGYREKKRFEETDSKKKAGK